MESLHDRYADSPEADRFPRPSFKVVMLYVDEETSIFRQLERAKIASLHNKRARDAGGRLRAFCCRAPPTPLVIVSCFMLNVEANALYKNKFAFHRVAMCKILASSKFK